MKTKDKILLTMYLRSELLRLQLKRLYLCFKIRYVFIYRLQYRRILLLRSFNMLKQKWSLYRLLAMKAALKQLYALFDHAETSHSRLLLWVAKILFVPIHFLCKLQHLTPETNKNPDFVNQPDKHAIIITLG